VVDITPDHLRNHGGGGVSDTPVEDLPAEWRKVGERAGETYRWPEYGEVYDPYELYEATTVREGVVKMAVGHAVRPNKWGRDRRYIVVFLTGGKPFTPLVEFLEADDYHDSREFLAVIRGIDGGRRMYGPSDPLPEIYTRRFRTQMYGQRVHARGIWNKVVVIAHEGDVETILNHALVQARRRGDI
jgi:hypothetical protein